MNDEYRCLKNSYFIWDVFEEVKRELDRINGRFKFVFVVFIVMFFELVSNVL